MKKDAAGAVALFDKACDGGEVLGCLRSGIWLAEGRGVPKNPLRAFNKYIRGCQLGDEGCCKGAWKLCLTTKPPFGDEGYCQRAVGRAVELSG